MNVFVNEVNNTVEIVDGPETVVVTVPTITTVNLIDIGPQGPKGDTGPQGPSGSGMPSEGLTGQVLAKKSNTSFDLEWKTVDVDVSALVPKTTTVNGKALSTNIMLSTADVSDSTDKRYLTDADLVKLSNTSGVNTGDQDLSGLVTKTTTVNGQALSSNVTLTTNNISDSLNKRYVTDGDLTKLANTSGTNTGDQDLSGYVPTSRTVNGQALSSNVTLTTAQIADSLDKRYVTETDLTKLGNTSGTNTGDQSLFSRVSVAGQSDIVADSTTDTLTLIGGTNIGITTNAVTDSITISAIGGGDVVGPSSSTDNALVKYDGTTGKLVQNTGSLLTDAGELQTLGGALEYVKFDTTPTGQTPVDGLVIYDSAEGTLDLTLVGANSSVKIGEQQFLRIYNDSGATLSRGQVVYISGAQGNRVAVKLARANAEATAKDTLGIVDETITAGAEGWVLVSGVMRRLNTSSFTAGDTVFLSTTTAGAFSSTKPVAPNHLVIIGFVARVHATVGSIYVKVNNGYEIDELHDVKITGTPVAGSLLVRDATEQVWENVTLTAGSHISVTNADASVTVAVSGAGSANGLATLDGGGKVPANQLPSSLMDYRGVWNASTNSPTLANGTGDSGDVYRVTIAGTQNLGAGAISFEVGDYVIYNGTIWEKSDTTDAVASVNSKTGIVIIDADDISDATTTKKFTTATDISRLVNTSGTNTGDQDLSGLVPKTTTVNGQALSANVSLTTADIADSIDKHYITDAQQTVLTNTSGSNSGDQNIFQRITIAGNSDVVADTTSDTLTLVAGTNVTLTTDASADSITINSAGGTNNYFNTYLGFGFKNALINSTFNVAQRIIPGSAISWATGHPISPNTDGNYNFDRWYMLCDGANRINITQETASRPVFGVQTGCRLTQVGTSASNGKFGLAQIVERANIPSFLNYVACLQAKLRVSNATRLTDIRLAVIGWTGTADTVTRDFISSWNASGVNPTLVANATYLNTPANMSIPDVWQVDSSGRPVIYNVATGVPSNVNNLIVFIYSNTVGLTAGDFLSICDVQLEANDSSTNFEYVPYDIQLMRAQRYYYALYASGTSMAYCSTYSVTSIRMDGQFTFPVFMRVPPTLVTSAASTFALVTSVKITCTSAPSGIRSYPAGMYLSASSTSAALGTGEGGLLADNGATTPASYLLMNAEL